jgi:hypothetical protein
MKASNDPHCLTRETENFGKDFGIAFTNRILCVQ